MVHFKASIWKLTVPGKTLGISESFGTSAQQNSPAEDTRKVLVNFIKDALGIEDATLNSNVYIDLENRGVIVEMVAVQL